MTDVRFSICDSRRKTSGVIRPLLGIVTDRKTHIENRKSQIAYRKSAELLLVAALLAAAVPLSGCGGTSSPGPAAPPADPAAAPAVNVSPLRGMRVVKPEAADSTAEGTVSTTAPPADILLIDDFNDGDKPNEIGGNYGAWNRDPLDETQGCLEEFNLENHGPTAGLSLKLTYDVESPNPAFNGFWMRLNEMDLSGYRELVFHVKGDRTLGYTTRVKVELKNNVVGEKGSIIVEGITDEWRRFRVPLNQFFTINDWTKMSEFVLVFDDEMSTKRVGAIYVDDIYFLK